MTIHERIIEALDAQELTYARFGDDVFEIELPGVKKLKTTCRLEVGRHALSINAFVARNPELLLAAIV